MYVTGNSTTRLDELQKFTHSTIFSEKYFGMTTIICDNQYNSGCGGDTTSCTI